MYRKKMSPRKDKKIFRSTATQTRAVNIPQLSMRGGIRF